MALGCVNNLLSYCRPSIPTAVSQFMSDHRERIEKIAMIAIFSATCLAPVATFSFSVVLVLKVSFFLTNPILANTVCGIGLIASAFFVFGHAFVIFPERLGLSAKRDFAKLLQDKISNNHFHETLTIEDKSRIRHIANQMKLSRLISSNGFLATITFLEMTHIAFAGTSLTLTIGASLLFVGVIYFIASNNYWSSSQGEVGSIEKAYHFIATSGVDPKLFIKVLETFYSAFQRESYHLNNEDNVSDYSLGKAIREKLTPKEVRDNFGAFAKMISAVAAESQQVSIEDCLGTLFQLAFLGDVPDDAELNASREVIQQAAKAAINELEFSAPERSLGRFTFAARSFRKVTTEELSKTLTVYKNFLERTGNAWGDTGPQVVEIQNKLGEGTSITDFF